MRWSYLMEKGWLAFFLSGTTRARSFFFGKASKDTAVSEIMTPKVVCVRPEQTAEECMAIMTEKRCRHLPVLSEKKLIGIISIGDVVRAMITDQQQTIEQLEQYIMS